MQQQSGPSVARTVALSTVSGFAPPPPPALSSSTSSSSFLPSTHSHLPVSSMQNDHIGGTISTSTAFPSSTASVSGSTLSSTSSTIQQGIGGEGSGALDENSRKRRAEENRIAALAKRQKLAETSSVKGTISTTSGGTSSSTNSSSSSTVLLPISHSSPVASESVNGGT